MGYKETKLDDGVYSYRNFNITWEDADSHNHWQAQWGITHANYKGILKYTSNKKEAYKYVDILIHHGGL